MEFFNLNFYDNIKFKKFPSYAVKVNRRILIFNSKCSNERNFGNAILHMDKTVNFTKIFNLKPNRANE